MDADVTETMERASSRTSNVQSERPTPPLTAAEVVALRHASKAAQKRSTTSQPPQNASQVLDRLSAWDARKEEAVARKKQQMQLHTQLVGASLSSRLDAISATPSPFSSFKSSATNSPLQELISPRGLNKQASLLSSQPLIPSPRPRASLSGSQSGPSRVAGLERVQLDLSQRPSGPAAVLNKLGSGRFTLTDSSPSSSLTGRLSTSGAGPSSGKQVPNFLQSPTPGASSSMQPKDGSGQKVTGLLSETVSGRYHTSILGSIIGKGLQMEEEEFREFMSYNIQADKGKRYNRTSLPSSAKATTEPLDPIQSQVDDDSQEPERGSYTLGLVAPEAAQLKSDEVVKRPTTAAEDITRMMRWKGGEALKGQLKKEAEEALAKRRSLTGEVQHPVVAALAASNDVQPGQEKNTRTLDGIGRTSLSSSHSFVQPDFRSLLNKKEEDTSDLRFSTAHKLTRGSDFNYAITKGRTSQGRQYKT